MGPIKFNIIRKSLHWLRIFTDLTKVTLGRILLEYLFHRLVSYKLLKFLEISVFRVMNVWLMIHDLWKTHPCEFQRLFSFYIISVSITTRNWLNIFNLLNTLFWMSFPEISLVHAPGICLQLLFYLEWIRFGRFLVTLLRNPIMLFAKLRSTFQNQISKIASRNLCFFRNPFYNPSLSYVSNCSPVHIMCSHL